MADITIEAIEEAIAILEKAKKIEEAKKVLSDSKNALHNVLILQASGQCDCQNDQHQYCIICFTNSW